ncbi:MAG: GNAT family N-acetyltransferase [Ilumatobacteraceae bacterium]
MEIRLLQSADLDACVALNNDSIPAVSEADNAKMQRLVDESLLSLVVECDGQIVGFCINFGPGADYASVNYRWFCDRYDDFAYLDRIVVAPTARNMGIGASIYAAVQEHIVGPPWLFCEVNLRPRNDGSLRFHERLGFVEVGQQETDYGILVSMLAKPLGPPTT